MKKKLFIAVFLLTNIFYTPNALSERERDSNRIDSFNTRNSLKTTVSVGVGVPSAAHIKYIAMTDNNWSFGVSLGTMLIGINTSIDARYYFNDLSYNDSLYTETNIGFAFSNLLGYTSTTFIPTQKIGFEFRAEEGFTFNIAGGLSYWSLNGTYSNSGGIIPSFDILIGKSF